MKLINTQIFLINLSVVLSEPLVSFLLIHYYMVDLNNLNVHFYFFFKFSEF